MFIEIETSIFFSLFPIFFIKQFPDGHVHFAEEESDMDYVSFSQMFDSLNFTVLILAFCQIYLRDWMNKVLRNIWN